MCVYEPSLYTYVKGRKISDRNTIHGKKKIGVTKINIGDIKGTAVLCGAKIVVPC